MIWSNFPVILFLVHLCASLMMSGIVWYTQIAHYPLFFHIGNTEWVTYAKKYSSYSAILILPIMFVEMFSGIALLFKTRGEEYSVYFIVGAFFLFVIWLSTLLIQLPQQRKLALGKDVKAIEILSDSNWIRTILWTARSGLMIRFLFEKGLSGISVNPF